MRPRLARWWAVVAVAHAALRVARLDARYPLDEVVARLRRCRRFPKALAGPDAYVSATNWLLPRLPPAGMGSCLKRALVLTELLSRCGVDTKLHLGIWEGGSRPALRHAWLSGAPGLAPSLDDKARLTSVAVL